MADALRSYLDEHFEAKFGNQAFYNAPDSGLRSEVLSILREYFNTLFGLKDISLIQQSMGDLEAAIEDGFKHLIEKNDIQRDVNTMELSDEISHDLIQWFMRQQFLFTLSGKTRGIDAFKDIISSSKIRNSKDRFLSLFNLVSKSIIEQMPDIHVASAEILNLNDEEKAYFVTSGSQIFSEFDGDILYVGNLPELVRNNALIMGLNRENGLISPIFSHPKLRFYDKERLESYSDKPFLMAIEALSTQYFSGALVTDDFGKGLTPFRRSNQFNKTVGVIVDAALSGANLQQLVKPNTLAIVGAFESCTTFSELASMVRVLKVPEPSENQPSLCLELIANHAFVLKCLGEQVLAISQRYVPQRNQPDLFNELEKDESCLQNASVELKALLDLLDGQVHKEIRILSFIMETMDLAPLADLLVDVINADGYAQEKMGFEAGSKGQIIGKLLGSVSMRCLELVCSDPRVDDEIVMLITKMASGASSMMEYMHHRHFIEDIVATGYSNYQLRKPDEKLLDELEKLARDKSLDVTFITSRFLQIVNKTKAFDVSDPAIPADMSFLSPKQI